MRKLFSASIITQGWIRMKTICSPHEASSDRSVFSSLDAIEEKRAQSHHHLSMLSLYLRFTLLVFSLSSISHCTFDSTSAGNEAIRSTRLHSLRKHRSFSRSRSMPIGVALSRCRGDLYSICYHRSRWSFVVWWLQSVWNEFGSTCNSIRFEQLDAGGTSLSSARWESSRSLSRASATRCLDREGQ